MAIDVPRSKIEEEPIDSDSEDIEKAMQKAKQIQIASERAKAREHVVVSDKWEAGWEAFDSDDDEEIERARKSAKQELDRKEAEENADWEAWDSDEERKQAARRKEKEDLKTKELMDRVYPDFVDFKSRLLAKRMKEAEDPAGTEVAES